MNREQHVAISEMLIETAGTLGQNPRTALAAGELIWGAAAHICNAAEGHSDAEHRDLRTKREWALVINGLAVDRQTRRLCLDGLDASQTLHSHFYTGQLSRDEVAEKIRIGTVFVRQMLRIARQS